MAGVAPQPAPALFCRMGFLTSKYGSWLFLAVGLILAATAYRLAAPAGDGHPAAVSQIVVGPPKSLPAFGFTDHDGKRLTLADFKGKLVVLDVWATWCAPCRQEFPRLDRLQAAMGGADFTVLALSVDLGGRAPVDKFYGEMKITALDEYLDPSGDSAKALGLRGLPTTLILDRQGQEVARVEGAAAWDGPEVKALLQKLLAPG
jgi:thiol-disulfide isomerase/thioredoxin